MRVLFIVELLALAAGYRLGDPTKQTALVAHKGCSGKEEPDCDSHSKDDVKPPCMANSEIIPGVDCGHVSEVIPKFQKSHLVGKLQGEATNMISDADAAANEAEEAAKSAKAAAKMAKDVGGKAAKGAAKQAEDAAKKAEDLATKATEASGALETSLDDMKTHDIKDTGPYAMPEKKIQTLKKDKVAAATATAAAKQGAAVALEEAADAQEIMLKSAEGALKLISAIVDETNKVVETAKELKQNATWAVKDVKTLDKATDELKEKVQKNIDDEEHEDQKPVFEAIYDNLDTEMSGAKTAAQDLNKLVVNDNADLPKAIKKCEDKIEPLAELKLEMERTGLPPDSIGKSMGKVKKSDEALKELKEAMFAVDQGVKSCVKRMKRVGRSADKAKKYKVDWAPPPMTPLGAIGAGKSGAGVKKGL
eukprot:gnl/MRDRNA2_/MRDRNA2_88692_c0_seq1.p1 gnl/MRDRNA2_/MRDRNA2_88692_c0~~gnl/MRDRNA2_/MRDRNA2_88692_c0_seq1.p1  ORF type:complete len:421 (-),score=156.03 gnl/MRDRNA2_/MRDRNA2_88692_c0_seq1:11-1273(-)